MNMLMLSRALLVVFVYKRHSKFPSYFVNLSLISSFFYKHFRLIDVMILTYGILSTGVPIFSLLCAPL